MATQGNDPPEAPTVNVGNDGDNNDSNSNGSTGSTGSSGSSSVDATAAKRKAFRALLFKLRLDPAPFAKLIAEAIRQDWTADEFLWELSANPRFLKSFPGIQALLDQGMSVGEAIRTWKGMAEEYKDVASDLGLNRLAKLGPKKLGFLIENNVDPEEFGLRLSILDAVKRNPEVRDAFNQILNARGEQKLSEQGFFKFLMGMGDRKLYDIWDATQLIQELGPEGLTARQARRLGKAIGAPGQPANLVGFTDTISQVRDIVGGEVLASSGIKAKDLALAALVDQVSSPDFRARARQTLGNIEQMVANAQASAQSHELTATSVVKGSRPISSSAPSGEYAG